MWNKTLSEEIKMKRREFLKSAALVVGSLAMTKKGLAQEVHKEHEMPHDIRMHMPTGWADPNIKLSPPPPLMGKQMGSVITPNVPPLGYEMDGKVKVFTLIAQPVEHYILDGDPPEGSLWDKVHKAKGIMPGMMLPKKIKGWGFNGSIPGPTIEAYEGDRVRIIVKNELPEPTSIHWHGLEVPNEMDGVGGLTQPPISPGETFIYEFTLYQSGTFMYHSGFNEKNRLLWVLAVSLWYILRGIKIKSTKTLPYSFKNGISFLEMKILMLHLQILTGSPLMERQLQAQRYSQLIKEIG
jgi:FtsP/CotA-like multicopper oxidase with cupredoxin domain